MKNEAEMLEALESDGIIQREGDLWAPGPKYEARLKPTPMKLSDGPIETTSKPFSEGLTEKRDIEIKSSLLAMQVRFLKHGKNWRVQMFGEDHILLTTKLVKSATFYYYPPEKKEGEE